MRSPWHSRHGGRTLQQGWWVRAPTKPLRSSSSSRKQSSMLRSKSLRSSAGQVRITVSSVDKHPMRERSEREYSGAPDWSSTLRTRVRWQAGVQRTQLQKKDDELLHFIQVDVPVLVGVNEVEQLPPASSQVSGTPDPVCSCLQSTIPCASPRHAPPITSA